MLLSVLSLELRLPEASVKLGIWKEALEALRLDLFVVYLLRSSGVKKDPRRGLVLLLRTMAPVMDGLRFLLASMPDGLRLLLASVVDDDARLLLLASVMMAGAAFFLVPKSVIAIGFLSGLLI